jgi:hypothetical protein
MQDACSAVEKDGYVMLRGVYRSDEVQAICAGIDRAFAGGSGEDPAIRGGEGTVYAARNVLRLYPEAQCLWRVPALVQPLCSLLGERFGLVRGLYFDKPPENSWALPWHKDVTIVVKNNRLGGMHFTHPTRKAGVPHVEASENVLAEMLTVRIHLDEVNDENGPLKVIPGSHRTGKTMQLEDAIVETLHASTGDVLLIRPLVAHCSNRSHPATMRHRRILHLEFSGLPDLPDGYAWHDFVAR